tara:strand:- start:307 stop:597 length:291 start_codon:yes stop_codon:yes gene_type:complete
MTQSTVSEVMSWRYETLSDYELSWSQRHNVKHELGDDLRVMRNCEMSPSELFNLQYLIDKAAPFHGISIPTVEQEDLIYFKDWVTRRGLIDGEEDL